MKDATAVIKNSGTNRSSFLMKNNNAPTKIAASLKRSKVESRTAPHLLTPLFEALATAPSNKSKSTKAATQVTPTTKSPLGKK